MRRFALRKGDFIKGATRAAATTEKYPALMRVDEINGMTPTKRGSGPASKISRRCSPTNACASSFPTARSR